MKKYLGIVCAVLALCVISARPAAAQATGSSKLAWDQPAPNVATASAYTYLYYPDGAASGIQLTSVTCTGTSSPFPCSAPFPAFTPGAHTLAATATNQAGESLKSTPLSFQFVVIPAAPLNLRIAALLNASRSNT